MILVGEDLLICEVCVILLTDGYQLGWGAVPLNDPMPIYLPITHPEWYSPHAHTPDDQAEAKSRLPANLSAEKQASYVAGFSDELHGILYNLVGTQPQYLYQLNAVEESSPAALQWPGLPLVNLAALDPNLARILGLYWVDLPPDPTKDYDYRLVAHYGQYQAPERSYDYGDLGEGSYFGAYLAYEGLTYASANALSVGRAAWDGSEWNALCVSAAVPGAPLSILLPPRSGSESAAGECPGSSLTVRGFAGPALVSELVVAAGESTLGFQSEQGINSLVLECQGEFALIEFAIGADVEYLLDVEYVSFHHRIETPPPVGAPALEAPVLAASRTGLGADGVLVEQQSNLDLHWSLPETGGGYLEPGAPVFYQVQRADRGNQAQPASIGAYTLLNADRPVLITANDAKSGSLAKR